MTNPKQDLIREAVERLGSINKAAAELGISRSTAQRMAKKAFEVEDLVSEDIPLEELKRRRFEDFERRRAARTARSLIRIKVADDLPLGLAWFGDPHLDNDGTDLKQIYRDADIVRETDGLFGMNVGDNQDLWPGRLMRLYADSTTKASDGWRLTEDFIKTVRDWMAIVWGNHDCWAGPNDPLKFLTRNYVPIRERYDVRIVLEFPNGREIRIWLRHNFEGHSQWNLMHGLVKQAKLGAPFHLFVAGDKHVAGHHAEYHSDTAIFWHALRVGSYKKIDSYADALNLRDANTFQCPVTIIDPQANSPTGLIKIEYDTADGADRLTWMRQRRGG